MATAEATPQRVMRWRASALRMPRSVVIALGLALLIGGSALLRARDLGVHYWIDEGLAIGISRHALLSIPHVLRQDGSPPLYFMLLHTWLKAVGTNENHTHMLSLLIALLTIPTALWACWSVFGARAGWIAAGMFALDPFLTNYAVETRMYALVVLLCLVATAAWLRAYVHGQRRFLPVFAVSLTALLYTHNWGFFFAAGTVVALAVVARDRLDRRRLAVDIALGYVPVALLFAPWVPTLIYQARNTGAPWAAVPSFSLFAQSPNVLLGGSAAKTALLLGAGAGLVVALRRVRSRDATAIGSLIVIAVVTILSAWLFSQVSPAWASRYLAVGLAPLLVLAAAGTARAGGIGAVSLILVAVSWSGAGPPRVKSNTAFVAEDMRRFVEPGDVVFASQPEEVPVLSLYMPAGLQYYDPLGRPPDIGVTDWINALTRLRSADVVTQLDSLVASLRPGGHLVFVRPIFIDPGLWLAPWTKLVKELSWESNGVLNQAVQNHLLLPGKPYGGVIPTRIGPNPIRGIVFTKI